MRILSRYIILSYAVNLSMALTALVAIFLVVDLTDRLSEFLDRDFETRTIFGFYLYYIPYTIILTLPMASLLSCLFTVGDLSRHRELTAMKAAGVSLGRILAPLFGAAFVLTLIALLFSDLVVPGANRRRAEIDRGGALEIPFFTVRENLVLRDVDGQILSIGRYEVGTKIGHVVSLDRFEGERLQSRITARTMRWEGDRWEWQDGIGREFVGEREMTRPFVSKSPEGLTLRPEDIERPNRKPEEMSYSELSRDIDRRFLKGIQVRKERVELNLKLAFPFAPLVMVLFGAPLISSQTHSGRWAMFGICLLLSFIYYGGIRGCQALGWNGLLSPALSAWLPNGVFIVVGAFFFKRAHK